MVRKFILVMECVLKLLCDMKLGYNILFTPLSLRTRILNLRESQQNIIRKD